MRTAPLELQYRTSWIYGVPMANTGWTSALFGTALTYPGCMSQRKRNGASQKMLFNSMILITVGMTSLYYCYYNTYDIYIYFIYCQCIAITLVYWHDNILYTAKKKTHRQKTSENLQTLQTRIGSDDRTEEPRGILYPDFTFYSWPESTCPPEISHDYSPTAKSRDRAHYSYDRWIKNTCVLRVLLD